MDGRMDGWIDGWTDKLLRKVRLEEHKNLNIEHDKYLYLPLFLTTTQSRHTTEVCNTIL